MLFAHRYVSGLISSLVLIPTHGEVKAPIQEATASGSEPAFVMAWKPNVPGCDDKFRDGLEERSQSTNQAYVIVSMFPDMGKLALHVFVGDPEKSGTRLEVDPDKLHLFKVTNKGHLELSRIPGSQIAKSLERRQRVAEGLRGFSAGASQTEATTTSADGTQTTVTVPNTQAQQEAIAQARNNIHDAQTLGASVIDHELKRNTLGPGQTAMGRIYYPSQKPGDELLISFVIGHVRYEFPYSAPRK